MSGPPPGHRSCSRDRRSHAPAVARSEATAGRPSGPRLVVEGVRVVHRAACRRRALAVQRVVHAAERVAAGYPLRASIPASRRVRRSRSSPASRAAGAGPALERWPAPAPRPGSAARPGPRPRQRRVARSSASSARRASPLPLRRLLTHRSAKASSSISDHLTQPVEHGRGAPSGTAAAVHRGRAAAPGSAGPPVSWRNAIDRATSYGSGSASCAAAPVWRRLRPAAPPPRQASPLAAPAARPAPAVDRQP